MCTLLVTTEKNTKMLNRIVKHLNTSHGFFVRIRERVQVDFKMDQIQFQNHTFLDKVLDIGFRES